MEGIAPMPTVDTVPVEALARIPDPAPTPDMQVADLLDGQRAATFGLAKYARVLAHLPPVVADALAAEYRHACALSPDEAVRYRPSASALARTCGMEWRAFNRAVARAILAARAEEAREAAFGPSSTASKRVRDDVPYPPGEGTGKAPLPSPRSRRGGAERATNAGRAAGKRGRGAAGRRSEA